MIVVVVDVDLVDGDVRGGWGEFQLVVAATDPPLVVVPRDVPSQNKFPFNEWLGVMIDHRIPFFEFWR